MEIESKNGSKIRLQQNIDFGRGLGFDSTDRTVSRRHISFKLDPDDGTRVHFQVKGKNPIWVRDSTNHDHIIKVYKNSQRGELNIGDSFCLSSKNPVWFHLKRIDDEIRYDEAFAEISGVDHDEIDTGDVSDIDPVKEFNFVVMGHEFDCYKNKLIRDIRDWNWFLEEANEDSDEGKGARKKRKKGGRKGDDDDDDVWTGDSEEDVELVKKLRSGPKPKYSTRSKYKGTKGEGASKNAKDDTKRRAMPDDADDNDDDDDEDDETLGGFIVDDEDIGGDDDEEEGDEEEEFEEDEDDE